jgi:hypothetical protein
VQSAAQVGQLAAYDICDAREAGPGTITVPPAWLNYRIGDCLTFQPEDGWTVKIIITGRALDASTGAVTYTVRSETDAKHAYALGESGRRRPPRASPMMTSRPVDDWTVTGTRSPPMQAPASRRWWHRARFPTAMPMRWCSTIASMPQALRMRMAGWAPAHEAPTTRKEITGITPETAYQVSMRYRVRGHASRHHLHPGDQRAGYRRSQCHAGRPSGTPVGSTG